MANSIFYAWQSDSPANINRNFIEQAVEQALRRIAIEMPLEESPRLDQDTEGETGLVEIAATIFRKISASMAIIADVTSVGTIGDSKKTPNPNVLIELGYAAHCIGWDRIITVMNTSFGPPDGLPFDIKHRRWPIQYELQADTPNVNGIQAKLSEEIERDIRLLLAKCVASSATGADDVLAMRNAFHRQLKEHRFANLRADDGVLSVFVVPADSGERRLDLPRLQPRLAEKLRPTGASGWGHRPGGRFFRAFSSSSDTHVNDAAAEIDEYGRIRSAMRVDYIPTDAGPKLLPSVVVEREPISAICSNIPLLIDLGFRGPFFIDIALLNLNDCILATERRGGDAVHEGHDIVPDLVEWQMDDAVFDARALTRALRPIFDFWWREFGHARSPNFNDDGEWRRR